MEPLTCDMPGYLVYRDDREAPHYVEGEDRHHYDTEITDDPAVCYEVKATLRDMTESEPSPPKCSGVHVGLHITGYGCHVTPRPTPYGDRAYEWTATISGSAFGPEATILIPNQHMRKRHHPYPSIIQTLECPRWTRQTNSYVDLPLSVEWEQYIAEEERGETGITDFSFTETEWTKAGYRTMVLTVSATPGETSQHRIGRRVHASGPPSATVTVETGVNDLAVCGIWDYIRDWPHTATVTYAIED